MRIKKKDKALKSDFQERSCSGHFMHTVEWVLACATEETANVGMFFIMKRGVNKETMEEGEEANHLEKNRGFVKCTAGCQINANTCTSQPSTAPENR